MRARATAALCCAVALAVAGCGGEDDSASEDEAPAPTSAPAAESDVDATMKGFDFIPAKITVKAGGTVTWTDEDSSNHNVKFKTPSAPEGINNLREGESASITFDEPGSYQFVCTYHPNMKGTVTVR